MFTGIIRKISDNENALRTSEMEGIFKDPPEKGKSFRIIGQAINQESYGRMIITSMVQEVEKLNNGWKFDTLNSTYVVEIIERKPIE